MERTIDYVIIGAGIVGLAMARELKIRHPNSKIVILEKESGLGKHSSGRNSGVLHSGIFYGEDSVKAKVCANGAKALSNYCQEKRLPIAKTGKVIVPISQGELDRLQVLFDRGKRNGIPVEFLNCAELRKIEPDVDCRFNKVLHLPEVSVIDPISILECLANDLKGLQVEIKCSQISLFDSENSKVIADGETISYGHLFNCAGLHADEIAKQFEVGEDYTILPFKGIYYRLSPQSQLRVHGLIYAVPDPRVPFLGIHYSRNVYDEVYLGPTVIPAFGRENYHGLSGVNIIESVKIMGELSKLYFANKQGFRTFVHREGLRFLKQSFYKAAQQLIPALKIEELLPSDKVGIRAQLLNQKKGELVMDFLVENGKNSTHILNAVSPAFTSSFAFAKLVLDQVGI